MLELKVSILGFLGPLTIEGCRSQQTKESTAGGEGWTPVIPIHAVSSIL